MRRKLLSILIVFAVVAMAVFVSRLINDLDGDGSAQASMSALGIPGGHSSFNRKSLAKEISLQPERLMNIRGQDVKMVLREPELVRQESPVTIWQYRSDSCVLDIYFNGGKDPLLSPVAHYEMRARAKGVSDETVQKDCVSEISRKSGGVHMIDVSALYKGYSD